MKKKLLLLCCTAALVLSACGGASSNGSTASNNTEQTVTTKENSEEENEQEANSSSKETEANQTEASDNSEEKWSLQQEVDEFGDVKKDGSTLAVYEINGTFSNTATKDSELGGNVVFDGDSKAFSFNLHEYNNTNATYTSSDTIVLKFKLGDGDTIYSHYLGGSAPNSALVLSDSTERKLNAHYDNNSTLSGFLQIGRELWYGNEVRCIIEIGSSSYSFSIEPSNFQDVSKALGLSFEDLPREEAMPMALQSYLNFDEYETEIGNPNAVAGRLLLNNLSEEDMIPESEYEDLMVGRWAYYDIFCKGRAGCIENNDDGTWTSGGYIYADEHDHKEDDSPDEWSVEDGTIRQMLHKYKLFDTGCEGYYVLYCVDDDGKNLTQRMIVSKVMVRLDDNCKPMYQPVYK